MRLFKQNQTVTTLNHTHSIPYHSVSKDTAACDFGTSVQTPPICVSVSPVSLVEQPSHTQLEVPVFFRGGLSMALCQTLQEHRWVVFRALVAGFT